MPAVILGQETLTIKGLAGLKAGRRTIHYDDIISVGRSRPNGHKTPGLQIRLKDGRTIRLALEAADLDRIQSGLEEIVSPALVSSEKAFEFEALSRAALELAASKGANVRKTVDFLINQAARHQAGDVRFVWTGPRLGVHFKIDGVSYQVAEFDEDLGRRLINCLKVAANLALYRRDAVQEGRIGSASAETPEDVRLSVLPAQDGERVVLRLFDKLKGSSAVEDLGFSPEILERLHGMVKAPGGLFIVGGPSGAGKTTTLYALLRRLEQERGRLASLISIEDPVEHRLPGIVQVQVSRHDGLDFAQILKSCLRQDPGVIMVGEIRDRETAEAAVQAALTGHLVLTTVHCGGSAEAVTRLLDLGVRPFLLTSALRGCLCQRLLRLVCSQCGGRDSDKASCSACRGTGYRGRIAVGEFLAGDTNLSRLIEGLADSAALHQAALEQGMIPLKQAALALVRPDGTDRFEVERVLG